MMIAVTYDNGEVFQHFGHCRFFKLYRVNNGKVENTGLLPAGESGHSALAGLLVQSGADVLICGGIGGGAKAALAEKGIKLYGGVSGSADEAVRALLAGELSYDPEAVCSHHGEHHGDGHDCSSHDCASHSCGDGSESCRKQ
ncbi:MAG: dinitrogenase iron-molybdenum cofactor biosynthesis protein [Oscillospiraceae bacterium]|nr:dinitrogenase iron-molybdenum cofactor biosynthesis protein [Oscillospiraceae bacterium]